MNSLFPIGQKTSYKWSFFRAGGVDQVEISKGSDLENLGALDPKLWLALACPTKGLELDARTLTLIDTDGDARIRPVELLAAVAWCKEAFANLEVLFDGGDKVLLSSIRTDTQAGRDLLAGAKRILTNLGKGDASEISLANVTDTEAIFAGTRLNGDGIVPVAAAESDEDKQLVTDIIATCGSVKDRGGEPGIDQPRVDTFFDEVAKVSLWLVDGDRAEVRTLGANTEVAFAAFAKLRPKLEDFFTRCKLLAYDERLLAPVAAADALAVALRPRDLSPSDLDLTGLPLAQPNRALRLAFDEGVNPAWNDALAEFRTLVMVPIVGDTAVLDEAAWKRIKEKFAAYDTWVLAKPASCVEPRGMDRVRAIGTGAGRAALTALIAADAALAGESSQTENVEKMIRFRRDIVRLVRNFVSFGEFYRTRKAIFQVGRLYVDGRACDLCLPVEDIAKHAALAGLAQSYLVYAECKRTKLADPSTVPPTAAVAEKQTIVAVVTAGPVDNLMVGRNGVFYDRHDGNWDATITKVIENPIDVRQAFWAPYKRFLRLIQEQVAKRAAAANEESNKSLSSHATEVASADKHLTETAAAVPPPPAPVKKIDVGTVAALGVAVGAIGGIFTTMLAKLMDLGMWMPFGLLGAILAISGPSMVIAWLKLRQRNIGPILDASGWAVNAFARINVSFGSALTSVAALPPGASRTLQDPFADKQRPWKLYITLAALLALAVLWFFGRADTYLPHGAKASTVFHRAPAPVESVR